MSEKTNFAADVWQTLNAINVNSKAEKKGNLTYLSWVWAWQTLMEHYPESSYQWHSSHVEADGSMTVGISLEVKSGDDCLERTMLLPVMDNRNNAILKPDAMEINTSRMRCLAKCISMFGLGSYIYAGEDLPEVEKHPQTPNQPQVSHDEYFTECVKSMDEKETLGEARQIAVEAYKHFKRWNQSELCAKIEFKVGDLLEKFHAENTQ